MAKHARKIAVALKARQEAFNGKGPSQNGNQIAHMPGSQNRKKTGFGTRSKRR